MGILYHEFPKYIGKNSENLKEGSVSAPQKEGAPDTQTEENRHNLGQHHPPEGHQVMQIDVEEGEEQTAVEEAAIQILQAIATEALRQEEEAEKESGEDEEDNDSDLDEQLNLEEEEKLIKTKTEFEQQFI